jgi:hypothetical protein
VSYGADVLLIPNPTSDAACRLRRPCHYPPACHYIQPHQVPYQLPSFSHTKRTIFCCVARTIPILTHPCAAQIALDTLRHTIVSRSVKHAPWYPPPAVVAAAQYRTHLPASTLSKTTCIPQHRRTRPAPNSRRYPSASRAALSIVDRSPLPAQPLLPLPLPTATHPSREHILPSSVYHYSS